MTDQNQKIRDRYARVKCLSDNEKLLAAFEAMGQFPDGTVWPCGPTPSRESHVRWLASAVDFALYQWPDRMSDACVALRKAVAEVESDAGVTPPGWCWWKHDHPDDEYEAMAKKLVGHPVWDMTIDNLTDKEQKLGKSRGMANAVWRYTNANSKECARQATLALRRMRTENTLDGYQTVYNRMCEAILDVLEGHWPVKSAEPTEKTVEQYFPTVKPVPVCQHLMVKVSADGRTVQGPCGKPVHSAAPNRAGIWYCEECVATLMVGTNGEFQERKKNTIERIKNDLDRPFRSPYLIGTGDLHGPKLL